MYVSIEPSIQPFIFSAYPVQGHVGGGWGLEPIPATMGQEADTPLDRSPVCLWAYCVFVECNTCKYRKLCRIIPLTDPEQSDTLKFLYDENKLKASL